jgi:hypothetical protein
VGPRVNCRDRLNRPPKSNFAGLRFPPEVILVAVRWYCRMTNVEENAEAPSADEPTLANGTLPSEQIRTAPGA